MLHGGLQVDSFISDYYARRDFSRAEIQHAEPLVELINSAYRGDASRAYWTTEADLLEGRRTDREQTLRLLADANSIILL